MKYNARRGIAEAVCRTICLEKKKKVAYSIFYIEKKSHPLLSSAWSLTETKLLTIIYKNITNSENQQYSEI